MRSKTHTQFTLIVAMKQLGDLDLKKQHNLDFDTNKKIDSVNVFYLKVL